MPDVTGQLPAGPIDVTFEDVLFLLPREPWDFSVG